MIHSLFSFYMFFCGILHWNTSNKYRGKRPCLFGPNIKRRFSQLMIVKPDYICTRHDMITNYLHVCDVCWHFLSLIVLNYSNSLFKSSIAFWIKYLFIISSTTKKVASFVRDNSVVFCYIFAFQIWSDKKSRLW